MNIITLYTGHFHPKMLYRSIAGPFHTTLFKTVITLSLIEQSLCAKYSNRAVNKIQVMLLTILLVSCNKTRKACIWNGLDHILHTQRISIHYIHGNDFHHDAARA